MKRFTHKILLTAVFFLAAHSSAFAEEFYCEVMGVAGTATVTNASLAGQALKEGDLLRSEDLVTVSSESYVDLAYDREWKNVTRIEENSKIRIRSVYPTTVALDSGGIYAKLKSLPKGSQFVVQTPVAIATARGTEYRTTYLEGETEIFNVSDSEVTVYGRDPSGLVQATAVVIHRSEKTQIAARGKSPSAPRRMEARDLKRAKSFHDGIENKVNENVARGHFGKIQDVKTLEQVPQEEPLSAPKEGIEPSSEAENRSGDDREADQQRNIPQTLSGDEARQAVQGVTGADEPGQPEGEPAATGVSPVQERSMGEGQASQETGVSSTPIPDTQKQPKPKVDKSVREFTDEEFGSAPSKEKIQEVIQGVRGTDGGIDSEKVGVLQKKVEDAIESSPPEQKLMLQNLRKQIDETVQRLARQQKEQK